MHVKCAVLVVQSWNGCQVKTTKGLLMKMSKLKKGLRVDVN